jgi:transcriptional regulator with XRE-family HTH domain
MTHPFGELSAQRRHLGAALRRLRREARLSGQQIADVVGLSQSQVSRIELGEQAASADVAERWAQATGATDDALAEVRELAETAATEAVSWRKAMARGLGRLQQDTRDVEASAATIRNFQPLGIPGLLQVPEYARRLFAAGYPPPSEQEVAAGVAARMDRQVILYQESKTFVFIMAAASLYWRPGPPGMMRAQLDRVNAVAALSNVTVGVIPLGAEIAAWCDHGFDIFSDRGEAAGPVVHVETLTSALNVADPEDVAAYEDAFSRLRAAAVTGDEARHLITEAAASLRRELLRAGT